MHHYLLFATRIIFFAYWRQFCGRFCQRKRRDNLWSCSDNDLEAKWSRLPSALDFELRWRKPSCYSKLHPMAMILVWKRRGKDLPHSFDPSGKNSCSHSVSKRQLSRWINRHFQPSSLISFLKYIISNCKYKLIWTCFIIGIYSLFFASSLLPIQLFSAWFFAYFVFSSS